MRLTMRRIFRIGALAVAMVPCCASASCGPGAKPTYDDVTYVKVTLYSLVGQLHPWFTFEGTSFTADGRDVNSATLDAHRATKLFGTFTAVDPQVAYRAVIDILRHDDFYAMHLSNGPPYVDGPEDTISAYRCGVETVLTTLPYAAPVDLEGAQAQSLFRLELHLQTVIFA